MVIGGHGDTTMIPLTDHAKVNDKPLAGLLSVDEIEKIASDTMVGGATLTRLLGTSACMLQVLQLHILFNRYLMIQKKYYHVLSC